MSVYTIRDIARLAGVSVTTVSRVLNHRPDVNQHTREKVEQIINEYHFVGNTNARGLKQRDQDVVAIIIRGRSNPFLYSLSESILTLSLPLDINFITEYIDEKDNEFETAIRMINQKHIIGFIFVGSRIDERSAALRKMDIPSVFTTVSSESMPFVYSSSVAVDDFEMGKAAAVELLNRGHRKIAVFGGSPLAGDSLSLRFQGVMEAFSEQGIVFDPDHYRECRFTAGDGYNCARSFFPEHKDVTALFAMSDMMAIGAIRALYDMDMKVPDDISVIGYDGVDIGRFMTPRLSTVVQPVEEIARQSLRMMIDMLDNNSPPQHILLPGKLLISETVRTLEV